MSNIKIKIIFVLPSLNPGGAERVITFVSQNLDLTKFDITVLIVSSKNKNSYTIDKNVRTIFLNKSRVLNAIPLLYKNISAINPNIVVSSISHLNTVMALLSKFFPKTKFVARESTVTGKRKKSKSPKSLLYNSLAKFTYPRFDKIICQSMDMKDDLLENYNISEEKVSIINNPITNLQKNDFVKNKIDYNNSIKYITVGRLVDVKGHLRILEALSKISFAFTYTIIGNGPKKNEIFAAIDHYGIRDKIIYIPYTSNVAKYLVESDFFLQGSYIEGFPNAALESCAVGTPVIAFNAPGGTKEIIENSINGYIAKNDKEFLEKMCEKHDWDATQIINSVYSKFGKESIMDQYTNLFLTI